MDKISLVFSSTLGKGLLASSFCLTSAKIMQGWQTICSLLSKNPRNNNDIGKHDIKKNKLEEIKT